MNQLNFPLNRPLLLFVKS